MTSRLGAIDIGTNSVRLLVADVDGAGETAELEPLDRRMRITRLGQGVDEFRRLNPEAISRTLDVLREYRGALDELGVERARATATSAARDAGNRDDFLGPAADVLHFEPELLPGTDEARLSFLGATAGLDEPAPYVTLDIGGGSTEFVVSEGPKVRLTESLPLGVVRLADRFGRSDPPNDRDRKAMKRAIRSAAKRAAQAVRKTGFRTCVGSSGTIQSLSLVHEAAIVGREPIPSGHRTLTRAALKRVNRILKKTTLKDKLRVPGLDPRRRDISVPGGILLAWFLKHTGADAIVVGERGLREGILLDHAARQGRKRAGDRDVRAKSVDRLLRRGNAEVLHAAHVARLALELFDKTHALHQLTSTEREWLHYGSLLHDVGCYVGYAKHQRHSYYLITHGDLTGFSAEEIEVIASIARYHKGKGPRESHENWKRLDPYAKPVVEKLAALVRVADGLDRSHRQLVTAVACRVRSRRVEFEAIARGDCEAELEAARRKADLFERVFDRRTLFRAIPAGREEAVHQKDLDMVSAEALWG